MFEDSTFESTGRIHTQSRGWMLATSAFNGSILFALVLIPLIYPHALPHIMSRFIVEAPTAPLPETKPPVRVEHVALVRTEMPGGRIFAPRAIPRTTYYADRPEALPDVGVATWDDGSGTNAAIALGNQGQRPLVREAVRGPVRISGMVVEGLLIHKTIPVYPPIALASGTQGTVVLQATISRNGTIENLRMVGGPAMLQRAAMDAVMSWRYRPYLLSGDPVEVETTINVVFKLRD